jgi:hypothetical protein
MDNKVGNVRNAGTELVLPLASWSRDAMSRHPDTYPD